MRYNLADYIFFWGDFVKKVINIKDYNFKYSNNFIFENFNMTIEAQNILIIGTPASGKTTLAKILSGIYKVNGIEIFGYEFKKQNLLKIKKKFEVVLNDLEFVAETVKNELSFGMENMCFATKKMKEKIDEIVKYFSLENVINLDPYQISEENKALIKILSYVVMEPEIIVVDDLFSYLDKMNKALLFKYLNEKNIYLFNITSDVNDIFYSDYVYLLDSGKIVIEGKSMQVIEEEKIFKRLGINLPFMIDLSKQLKSYELINKTYYNPKELVDELWK